MQNFFRGHRVKVAKKLPKNMGHFDSDCEAIIVGSYSDQYTGDDAHDNIYALLLLLGDKESWYTASWYDREYLTLISTDRNIGEKILQEHKILMRELEERMEENMEKYMAKKP